MFILWYTYTYTSEYFMYTKYNYTYMCESTYMNTIGDMQNEKYFYDHYKKFEYNQDYVKH